jgi:hypothetical protein
MPTCSRSRRHRVVGRTAQNIEERGDLTLAKTTPYDFGQSSLSLLVGVLGLQRVGDATVNTILLGQSLAFATPGKNDVAGVYAGAGFDWRTRSGWSFFASGDFLVMTDSSTVITGKGGVKLAFQVARLTTRFLAHRSDGFGDGRLVARRCRTAWRAFTEAIRG